MVSRILLDKKVPLFPQPIGRQRSLSVEADSDPRAVSTNLIQGNVYVQAPKLAKQMKNQTGQGVSGEVVTCACDENRSNRQ